MIRLGCYRWNPVTNYLYVFCRNAIPRHSVCVILSVDDDPTDRVVSKVKSICQSYSRSHYGIAVRFHKLVRGHDCRYAQAIGQSCELAPPWGEAAKEEVLVLDMGYIHRVHFVRELRSRRNVRKIHERFQLVDKILCVVSDSALRLADRRDHGYCRLSVVVSHGVPAVVRHR